MKQLHVPIFISSMKQATKRKPAVLTVEVDDNDIVKRMIQQVVGQPTGKPRLRKYWLIVEEEE